MSFVLRKCFVQPEFKQLKKLNRSPQSNLTIELRPDASAKDILEIPTIQFHRYNCRGVTPSGDNGFRSFQMPSKPVTCSPVSKSKDSSPEELNSNSGYALRTACLGPFIDSRHWFAEIKSPRCSESSGSRCKGSKGKSADTDEGSFIQKINKTSLEQMRKRLKTKNLKQSETPDTTPKKSDN